MEQTDSAIIATFKIAETTAGTDALVEAERKVLRPADLTEPYTQFNSLAVVAEEFGTFLTAYDSEFMSSLNHLYDCVKYSEKKRTMKNSIEIPNPQLNIIAATTPAWLGGTLPETAWSEGFSSRLLMIFSGERIKVDLFSERTLNTELQEELLGELRAVHGMYGKFSFEEAVVPLIQDWYMADCEPVPDHPKLEHYIPRRHIHFIKLCMVMSASRACDYVITTEDFQNAMDLLLEAEAYMPDVFKSMTYNSDANVLDETFAFVWKLYSKDSKPVQEDLIVRFMLRRLPSHSVMATLKAMIDAGMLIPAELGDRGRTKYKPAPKTER